MQVDARRRVPALAGLLTDGAHAQLEPRLQQADEAALARSRRSHEGARMSAQDLAQLLYALMGLGGCEQHRVSAFLVRRSQRAQLFGVHEIDLVEAHHGWNGAALG